MKNIKIFCLLFLIMLSGCEKFLDINNDPNSPTTPAIDQLLPGIEYDMADDFSIRFGALGYVPAVYIHQMTTREEIDQYGVRGSTYNIQTYWKDLYYGPLMDLKVLIEYGEETDNLIYAGIGKILKAYIYSLMVDVWGDIPYSEATTPGNLHPVFDNDEAIYADLFTLIDDGINNIQNTSSENIRIPANDDLIYNGNKQKWIKFANTLKLKLYNQVRLTSMFDATAVNNLLAGSLISSGDDFMVPFGPTSAPDNRHPAFVSEYGGAQISNYISPWFYEILTGQNANIFTGIFDPRVPYYWVNQLSGGEAAENPSEYRDGDFNSIYFGSVGVNRDHAGRASFTMMGIYPCGGKYDDGTGGGPLDGTNGTGAVPQRFLTYADRLFIEAELCQVGLVSGIAADKLRSAIIAAFQQVNNVVVLSGEEDVPLIPADTIQAIPYSDGTPDSIPAVPGYIGYAESIISIFNLANDNKKLEIIMTQKWISSWGASIDTYTDYRRTGYPVLFDPNSNGGIQSGGANGSGPVPTLLNRGYPLSFPYDADEITLNNNAPDQKTITSDRVFWDIE